MNSSERRLLFIHVMKTAGTTLNERLFFPAVPAEQRYPNPEVDGVSFDLEEAAYWRADLVPELPAERLASLRFVGGHFGAGLQDSLRPLGFETAIMLRDPVDRVISHIQHCRNYHAHQAEWSLEEIYDDETFGRPFMRNFQTKVLAIADPATAVYHRVELDDAAVARAIARLHEIEHIGFQHDFDGFARRLSERFGWAITDRADQRVGSVPCLPPALRERIENDHVIDRRVFDEAKSIAAARG